MQSIAMSVQSLSREKLCMRASTATSGFSVRQSQEAIRVLEKEKFNLQLKMFHLESRKGSLSSTPEADEHSDGDYFDLFIENESMRNELDEKQALLKKSFQAIQILEEQKLQLELKCQELIKEQHSRNVQDMNAQVIDRGFFRCSGYNWLPSTATAEEALPEKVASQFHFHREAEAPAGGIKAARCER